MSNAQDEQLMVTHAWQAKVAQAIRSAVDQYFRQRLAKDQ